MLRGAGHGARYVLLFYAVVAHKLSRPSPAHYNNSSSPLALFRIFQLPSFRYGPAESVSGQQIEDSVLDTNLSNSSIYIAFGACCCCCSSVSHPHFERACSARQPDIVGSESLFCATYHANNWSNCARIANVCRIRKYARKPESVEIIVSLLCQSLPANQE